MKFKLIDKEKKGFARYCPTFARVWQGMKERMKRLKEKQNLKHMAKNLKDDNCMRQKEKLGGYDLGLIRDGAYRLGAIVNEGEDIQAEIPALAEALKRSNCMPPGDEPHLEQRPITYALNSAARKGTDISVAINPLLISLKSMDNDVQEYASKAILYALIGKNSESALNALIEAICDENPHTRADAIIILKWAAEKEADIRVAIPMLLKALSDPHWDIRRLAVLSLAFAASQCDHEVRENIVSEILKFVRSDWFLGEAEKNGKTFIRTAEALDNALDRIRKSDMSFKEVQP